MYAPPWMVSITRDKWMSVWPSNLVAILSSEITVAKSVLLLNVKCRWCPSVPVTRLVGVAGQQRWRRFREASETRNLRAVDASRCCNRQPWCHGGVGCQGDDVISTKVLSRTKPSHDWRPAAVLRNTAVTQWRHFPGRLQRQAGSWNTAGCSLRFLHMASATPDLYGYLLSFRATPLSRRYKIIFCCLTEACVWTVCPVPYTQQWGTHSDGKLSVMYYTHNSLHK